MKLNRLDTAYLNDLVSRAKRGSSNAFAELFAAVSERHYSYIMHMTGSESTAKEAMEEVYTRIHYSIGSLHSTELFMAWSMRLCFQKCRKESTYDTALDHIIQLPVMESQILIMHMVQSISVKDTADLLNLDVRSVKRSLKSAIRHLQRGDKELADSILKRKESNSSERVNALRPDPIAASGILGNVYENCGADFNKVPLEALSSYAVYRRERFSLQRAVLAVMLVIFLLLPLLFVKPEFDIETMEEGERGLPVYTINLRTIIPAGKVLARLRTHDLPVYEAGPSSYTVEPTRNGTLTIQVELINRQSTSVDRNVTEVDSEGPKLKESDISESTVRLTVTDSGIGVDFRNIYAKDAEGNIHYPLSAEPAAGSVIFEYPENEWDVYIPDYIGNTLHLTFTFE